jgi:hypothetical protein
LVFLRKFISKNSFNLKGYGFDVLEVLIWLDFTDNINNGYYATALQMPKPLLMQKNKLEAGTDGGIYQN